MLGAPAPGITRGPLPCGFVAGGKEGGGGGGGGGGGADGGSSETEDRRLLDLELVVSTECIVLESYKELLADKDLLLIVSLCELGVSDLMEPALW